MALNTLLMTPPILLITQAKGSMSAFLREYKNNKHATWIMTDLIYIGVVVAFFLFSGYYARFCEKL